MELIRHVSRLVHVWSGLALGYPARACQVVRSR